MKRFVLVLFFVSVTMANAFSQVFFTKEKSAFFNELKAYLESSTVKSDREEAVVLMSQFSADWNAYYGSSDADLLMDLYERLHAKSGARAYPNIFSLTEALHRLPKSGMTHQDASNWLNYIDQKYQKSFMGFDKFMASCCALFDQHVLSEKGNSKWVLRGGKIGFPFSNQDVVTVNDASLALMSSSDESVISSVSGAFRLESKLFEGNSGRVDWSRFNIPTETAYAVLPNHYEINLNLSEYAVDSVIFYERHYFNQAFLCRLEDKVLVNTPVDRMTYPRVRSYRCDYKINNILQDVDYEGGIGLMGNQVDVFGDAEKKASFVFLKKGKKVASVHSRHFLMSLDDVVVSDHTEARFYLRDTLSGKITLDSIYHNGLGFRYENQKRKILLYRSEKNFDVGPFHDTYHKLDIFIESLNWILDDNVVDFKRMEGPATVSEGDVVSLNYFRQDDFVKLRALDGTHSMVRIEKYLHDYGNPERPGFFYTSDLATYLGYPIEQVVSLLLRLQSYGYLNYNIEDKSVVLLQRFYDVLESNRDNIDYDVIKLHTKTENKTPNARLDLNTNDLIVFGITSDLENVNQAVVSLSDRKHVVIIPDNNRIVFKKNRDFRFSGGIMAGMFEFFTKDCLFSYDDFMIDMAQVDSLRFYASTESGIIPVEGTLEKLQGRLFIDRADNKSSKEQTQEYPIFHSDVNAYKFYRKINGGVFHPGNIDTLTAEKLSGKFYYYLYPFTLDSMNDFRMRKVSFDGELVSGGILPVIKEPLMVMDDYALGFDHKIGNEESDSYPMYGGLGRFHKDVHLSEHGFYGDGTLDYQTASYNSDQFMFYLDSVTATADVFKMTPNETFPLASGDAVHLKWDVYKPELMTETLEHPICMYDNTYFSGKTFLSSDSYRAEGKMKFGLTEFESDYFDFKTRDFVADSARFVLYSADSSSVAFAAINYRANVDFDAQKVQYDYLDEGSNLEFPLNQYVCTLKEAEWDMASNSLHVYNPVDGFGEYVNAKTHKELLGIHDYASKFISLVPEQDSLQFYSLNAEYDMTNYTIHAHDVKIIRVADAAVFPYTQDLTINSESELEPVCGELLADTLNAFHLFKDAKVEIKSRKDYVAQADLDYVSSDGLRTPIRFDSIVPIEGVTHAYAKVPDSAGFYLSPQFAFYGDVVMNAKEQFGEYDGHFAIMDLAAVQYDTSTLAFDSSLSDSLSVIHEDSVSSIEPSLVIRNWFSSKAVVNPEQIQIPVDMGLIRKEDPDVCNGMYYELSRKGGYFVSFLASRGDRAECDEVEPVKGILTYEADSVRYVVMQDETTNSYLTLDSRDVVRGHGTIDLGMDGGLATFAFHGDYVQYPNDSLVLNGFNVFSVPVFDDALLQAMAEVYAGVEGESIDLMQTQCLDYYRSENPAEDGSKLLKSIELQGYPEIKDFGVFNHTIVIPDLKMLWNENLQAFISVGKVALGNLGGNVVNKYVDGYVIFDRRLGNITYFFQNDLFMTYINYNCGDGQMQIHATWGDVNQRIYDKKEKLRSVVSDGKKFEYVAVPYESLVDFLNKIRRESY